jgi:hypothetical protein
MVARLAKVRSWISNRSPERVARRTAVIAFWSVRVLLGIALVVFALSFAGPPPVDLTPLEYGAADAVAADAVHNLRTASYLVTIDVRESGDSGDAVPVYRERRTVDNAGHRVLLERRQGEDISNSSLPAERLYGTYTTGFHHPGGNGANWTERPRYRYHPSRNAFANPAALNGSNAIVLTDTADRYAIRVTDRDAVFETVEIPGHTQPRAANGTVSLRLVVDRQHDRLRRATYTYAATNGSTSLTATYRFDYGAGADLDRPLGTYPPGEEVLTRFDLGLRAIESVVGGEGG